MIKKKHIITSISIIIITPLIVNFLMLFSTPITKGSISDWISFYGSFFGAVIGGIVAYIIASIQIESHKENEKTNRFIVQLPTLVQLDLELNRLVPFLTTLHEMAKSEGMPQGLTFDRFVLGSVDRIPSINKEYWDNIDKIIDVNILNKIIKFREFYYFVCEIASYNLNDIGSKLNIIDIKLRDFEKIEIKNEKQKYEIEDLIAQKMPLLNLYNSYISDKQWLWSELKKVETLLLPNELQTDLRAIISQIQKKM